MHQEMAAPLAVLRFALPYAVVLAGAAAGTLSSAAAPMSLRAALTGRHVGERPDPPVIGRYETDEGGEFVLDRSAPKPLLKFDDNPEIWVLQPAPGPSGDTIYRNDVSETMLRATHMGGMTVFTLRRPDGSAAALDGASTPLHIPPLSPLQLYNRFFQASVRASRATQHEIAFQTGDDAEPSTAAVMADAATVASQALVEMASRSVDKALVARIMYVVIGVGPRPAVALTRGVLAINIVPAEGVAGRPSSRRIEKAAGAK
jgi:Domain of unknown function (DUF4908)